MTILQTKTIVSVAAFIIATMIMIYGQDVQTELQLGVKYLTEAKVSEAKVSFRNVIKLDPTNYVGYNFLGVAYYYSKEYDTSIVYLRKSIELNSMNIKHSREMTIARLASAYLYGYQFRRAYETCLNGAKEFPENRNILTLLRDVCLWSYYIGFEKLDRKYLSTSLSDYYVVTSVAQEYLILRAIKVNDHALIFMKQELNTIDGEKYDLITCRINKTSDSLQLKYKLAWDFVQEPGGKMFIPKEVANNQSNEIWERIGARLSYESELDVLKEDEILRKSKP